MFRKPRENAHRHPSDPLKPATGRPPSPLHDTDTNKSIIRQADVSSKSGSPTLAQNAKPIQTRQDAFLSNGKIKNRGNSSILSFFKKTERPEETLFVNDGASAGDAKQLRSAVNRHGSEIQNNDRYHELGESVKKRKTSHEPNERMSPDVDAMFDDRGCTPPPGDMVPINAIDDIRPQRAAEAHSGSAPAYNGPFLDGSDSEDEPEPHREAELLPKELLDTFSDSHVGFANQEKETAAPDRNVTALRRASTSYGEASEDFADFEDLNDFDDEYDQGEEFVNKRYMQKHPDSDFEGAFEGELLDEATPTVKVEGTEPKTPNARPVAESGLRFAKSGAVASCPICNVSFDGVSDQEASVHANHCLDGNPTPLPKSSPSLSLPSKVESNPSPVKRQTSNTTADTFKKSSRPAKPGQCNPVTIGENGGSAFSRLMSGHSEEAAFAGAAASEKASYGKPSYQRTCPFYKILPGFYTCVDAFRYGAVEGCNAYFLSHFHSDHYVGLTSNWSHGPIYCSGPTGRLVKQQLKVNPIYVKELEWEKEFDIPGTKGVRVTMIPANHCPGSSIFLFEKEIASKPASRKPHLQRVLHCGDFRACPAHVEHPLLKPDVMDKVSGKVKEQKIDVCYLDTTYLSPKYAFPSQEDVIKACADICVTLNKDSVDEDDKFAQLLREKTGGAMARFVQQTSTSTSPSPTKPRSTDPKATLLDLPAASAGAPDGKGPLLVVVGTYSIGKERICLGIARALNSLIYAPPAKQRICAALADDELNARLTSDPLAAQVHMTPLFEIRADTLADYRDAYAGRFARAVGFRPSGWNFRSPAVRGAEPTVSAVLHAPAWKSGYTARDLTPQRGSTPRAACFGVPYSEHSSFRELAMFCCALRIDRVIPTVNVGSAAGRSRMKGWVERWAQERRKNGLFQPVGPDGRSAWYPCEGTWGLRTTL